MFTEKRIISILNDKRTARDVYIKGIMEDNLFMNTLEDRLNTIRTITIEINLLKRILEEKN